MIAVVTMGGTSKSTLKEVDEAHTHAPRPLPLRKSI